MRLMLIGICFVAFLVSEPKVEPKIEAKVLWVAGSLYE